MPLLTMTLLSGPGRPVGDDRRRIRIALVLDGQGAPDSAAWEARTHPWEAGMEVPDGDDREGDIQHDPDFGWFLRLPEPGDALADATTWSVVFSGGGTRPGSTAVTRGPDGEDWAWRIVTVAGDE